MVNNRVMKLILLTLLNIVTIASFADTQLSASVDRSKIYEMDTLNLTIQGQVDMDFSFGGLMNFGLGQSEAPEIKGLENDFEVLDTQQSYNMQSINGESKAQVLWRYTLAPKNSGVLEIPAANYKGAETKPIQITVIEGKAPQNAQEPPAVFLEVETDKKSAYVQEQIIYTLRLYTQGLVNGELSDPSSTDAIIEPFGEQKKYYRMAFNQRYEVIERQYLIFPQKSGTLAIGKQVFQGVSLKHGRRTRLKDQSDSIELSIKPPASSFSGKNWLPATSLFLNEQWQGDIDNLKVGDSITRKIELSALGLLGSALPPISMKESNLYKLYTDKPQTESVQHESGAQAKRTDSFAVVAIKDGEINLDEIRIPWWDTVNDVERVAVIPAKSISIAVNPQVPSQADRVIPKTIDLKDPSQTEHTTGINDSAIPNLADKKVNQQISGAENHLWQTATGIIFILWILTTVYLYKQVTTLKAKLNAVPLPKQPTEANEKEKYNTAITAVKNNDNKAVQAVVNWLDALYGTSGVSGVSNRLYSIQDIKTIAPSIYELLIAHEASSYSKNQGEFIDKDKLLSCLKEFREENLSTLLKATQKPRTEHAKFKAKELESFYS